MKLIDLHFKFRFIRQIIWSTLISVSVLILFFIFSLAAPVETSIVGWEKIFTLSPPRTKIDYFKARSKGNVIALVYESNSGGRKSIYAKVSLNQGKTFFKPVKVWETNTSGLNYALRPDVAISGEGHLNVVWQKFEESDSRYNIYYSTSRDFGATWSGTSVLNAGNSSYYLPKTYYDDENQLHFFYHELKENSINLYHMIRNRDMIFSEPLELIELPDNMRGAFFPAIATQGRYFFILWQGKTSEKGILKDDIFFIRSLNYGNSWTDPTKITRGQGSSGAPSLIISNKKLYCAYQNNDENNWKIKLLKSSNWGESWDIAPTVISDTNIDSYSPTVVKGENDLKIFWYDNRDGVFKVYSRDYNLLELKLSSESKLTGKSYSSKNPKVISFGKRMVLFWKENNRIRARVSDISVKPPVVFSRSHPSGRWVRNDKAIIRWKKPVDDSGIAGYATIVNDDPYFNPTVQNIEGNITETSLPFLKDGRSYFHIRAIDGAGNYSRTAHYPINVSKNPLPMPVIISKTHEEGKGSDIKSPLFTWKYNEMDRTKGFLYNIKRGALGKPDKFIEDFKVRFEDLPEGRYFFSLRALDKINTPGRIATYEIIVGNASTVDPSIYQRIAKRVDEDIKEVDRPSSKRKRRFKFLKAPIPLLAIKSPLTSTGLWASDSMAISFQAKDMGKAKIEGFSYHNGSRLKKPDNRIDIKGGTFYLNNLKNGSYHLSVKARYSYYNGRRTVHRWTDVVKLHYQVKIPEWQPDLFHTYDRLSEKIGANWPIVLIVMVFFLIFIIYMGFEGRLIFVFNAMVFKLKNIFKLLFS